MLSVYLTTGEVLQTYQIDASARAIGELVLIGMQRTTETSLGGGGWRDGFEQNRLLVGHLALLKH